MKKHKSQSTLTISAVAFIAALIIDLYLIIAAPSNIELIIALSLIVIVDTYFLVDGILSKVDEIATISIDKQNELTKVEKGIYSVAKREEVARSQSMSALLDIVIELKEESYKLKQDTDNEIKEKKKEIQDLKNLVESRENSLNKHFYHHQEKGIFPYKDILIK